MILAVAALPARGGWPGKHRRGLVNPRDHLDKDHGNCSSREDHNDGGDAHEDIVLACLPLPSFNGILSLVGR